MTREINLLAAAQSGVTPYNTFNPDSSRAKRQAHYPNLTQVPYTLGPIAGITSPHTI